MKLKAWSDFKSIVDSRGLLVNSIDVHGHYYMKAFDGPFEINHIMEKTDPASADQTDFENNYLPNANKKLDLGADPFSAKVLKDGKKLFRRVHGVVMTLVTGTEQTPGETKFEIVVPYAQCKINEVQIFWAPEECQVDLKVYDTPTGTITSTLAATGYNPIPNFMLNQFGFDAGVAKDFFREKSNYDADLIQDMKVEATLKNPTNVAKKVCVNFILHEMK